VPRRQAPFDSGVEFVPLVGQVCNSDHQAECEQDYSKPCLGTTLKNGVNEHGGGMHCDDRRPMMEN
jgi:hypothetical protein